MPSSTFLEDSTGCSPRRWPTASACSAGPAARGSAAPGLHGNGLGTVTLGGQTLTPGGSPSITLTEISRSTIQVANQGENTETDVQVNVTVGQGGDAIKLDKPLDTIAAGETKTVEIPLAERRPRARTCRSRSRSRASPGEKKTDNNKGAFAAIFTR